MKKLLLTSLIIVAFLSYTETKAQFRVNLNVNIGARPNWGLAGNYDGNYYYLPEIDTYYDIAQRQFIYFDGRDWDFAYELPYAYRDYDLYNGFKVVINEPRPYLNCNVYRTRYSNYYNNYNNYRRPAMVARGPVYRIGDDRNSRGWNDERYERRRESDRNNRYEREDNNRYDRDDNDRRERGDDRGRGNDHDNGHGWGRRGRG